MNGINNEVVEGVCWRDWRLAKYGLAIAAKDHVHGTASFTVGPHCALALFVRVFSENELGNLGASARRVPSSRLERRDARGIRGMAVVHHVTVDWVRGRSVDGTRRPRRGRDGIVAVHVVALDREWVQSLARWRISPGEHGRRPLAVIRGDAGLHVVHLHVHLTLRWKFRANRNSLHCWLRVDVELFLVTVFAFDHG